MKQANQSGFVLILVLWVLVIVAIAAGYFSEQVTQSVRLAEQSRQNIQALLDHSDTRAEILYKLATSPMTSYGLGNGSEAIALDGRPYQGRGNVVFRLQDTRGLFNLNQGDDASLHRFLGGLEVPADERGRLVDALRDYVDSDNLRRLNGAEKQDYFESGLPPPANRPLTTVFEAKRILGWRNVPALWRDGRLVRLSTASLGSGINPNTAPMEVLQAFPNVSTELAREMVARRQQQPFVNIQEVSALTGANPMQLIFTMILFPGNSVRVTQSLEGGAAETEYEITLTPQDGKSPWKINYMMQTFAARR